MRNLLIAVTICIGFVFFVSPVHAATTPSSTTGIPMEAVLNKIASLKIKDLQHLTGRKLTVKEKLGFWLLKRQIKRGNGDQITRIFAKKDLKNKEYIKDKPRKKAEGTSKGQTALVIGIIGLALLVAGLFIPYVIIGSLVASILAIVLGSIAKKENPSDTKAGTAKLLGWINLGLIALLIIAVAVALSGWGW